MRQALQGKGSGKAWVRTCRQPLLGKGSGSRGGWLVNGSWVDSRDFSLQEESRASVAVGVWGSPEGADSSRGVSGVSGAGWGAVNGLCGGDGTRGRGTPAGPGEADPGVHSSPAHGAVLTLAAPPAPPTQGPDTDVVPALSWCAGLAAAAWQEAPGAGRGRAGGPQGCSNATSPSVLWHLLVTWPHSLLFGDLCCHGWVKPSNPVTSLTLDSAPETFPYSILATHFQDHSLNVMGTASPLRHQWSQAGRMGLTGQAVIFALFPNSGSSQHMRAETPQPRLLPEPSPCQGADLPPPAGGLTAPSAWGQRSRLAGPLGFPAPRAHCHSQAVAFLGPRGWAQILAPREAHACLLNKLNEVLA